jgi:uncharacterized protein YbjT (DUF2867 family)
MSKSILVTGATGKQGGSVARVLLSKGERVRAMTRDPNSPAARALGERGAELVHGDFADETSLERALDGVDSVFAMGSFFEKGVEAEAEQGIALVEAARRAGVGHLVYTSVASADKQTGIPHFDSKAKVEQALVASGVPWTILAPVYFMENLFFPQTWEALQRGVYSAPLSPGRKLQQIAVEDIGQIAALALQQRWLGRRLELAGDELSPEETVAHLSRATGRPIRFESAPLEVIRQFSQDLYLMYKYFDEVGYAVDIAELRREFPEVRWHRYQDWVATQSLPRE